MTGRTEATRSCGPEAEHGCEPPKQRKVRYRAVEHCPKLGFLGLGLHGELSDVELPVIHQPPQQRSRAWTRRHPGSLRTVLAIVPSTGSVGTDPARSHLARPWAPCHLSRIIWAIPARAPSRASSVISSSVISSFSRASWSSASAAESRSSSCWSAVRSSWIRAAASLEPACPSCSPRCDGPRP